MRTEDVPVLVVGGGPVGLSTGMFLAHWGVPPVVVEKRDAISALPRATSSLRTLEVFRSMGLLPALERVGWRGGEPLRTVYKGSGLGATLHRGGLPERYERRAGTATPVDRRLVVTQDQVQRLALEELRRGGGDVRFGTRLVGLVVEADRVRARVADAATGEEAELRAEYLVAADGAHSDVRGHLGVTVPDREVIGRVHTAYFRADLGPFLREWGTQMCVVRNDAVYATLLSKNGRDQWSSHILDHPGRQEGPAGLTAEETVALLRAAIGDRSVAIELHAVNAWEAAIGMASSFREGRVFLAGDAAHVQTSAGGLGMNTGIQDGHNLAWKIAAVLRGRFTPALLDTYEPERRAAARASLSLSRAMSRRYQSAHGDPGATPERLAEDYLRAMMFHGYPPHGTDRPDVLADAVRVGHRFPHRWVGATGTARVSTLDLIGSRWTLFAGADHRRWRAAAASLRVAPPVHGPCAVDGAVLVRPDGFVAWRGNAEDSLRDALRDLGLRQP
ncbi:FAD-dependent oxidoreductase [Streptomyces capparidis]